MPPREANEGGRELSGREGEAGESGEAGEAEAGEAAGGAPPARAGGP